MTAPGHDRDCCCTICEPGEDYEPEGCEGHYDDDSSLTSGVGIGEPAYCDGTCRS